jgi:hypothetical protein
LSQILKFLYDLSLALEMSEDWRAFQKTRINHGGFGKAVTRIGKKILRVEIGQNSTWTAETGPYRRRNGGI